MVGRHWGDSGWTILGLWRYSGWAILGAMDIFWLGDTGGIEIFWLGDTGGYGEILAERYWVVWGLLGEITKFIRYYLKFLEMRILQILQYSRSKQFL